MYRKDFIKNSLILGLVVSTNPKLSGAIVSSEDAYESKPIINGLKGFDAHSHPYHFHTEFSTGRLKNLRTTSTISRMEQGDLLVQSLQLLVIGYLLFGHRKVYLMTHWLI